MESYNYTTYYFGTPREIEESSSLVLLKSPPDFNLSPENLKELVKDENPSLIKRAWKDEEGIFNLTEIKPDLFEFDLILYYNKSADNFVGYTLFSSLQRCYSSAKIPFGRLKISLNFKRIEGEGNGFFIKLQTFLDSGVENTEILGTTERWEYQESKLILPSLKDEPYLKFTNKITDYLGNPELCIITDSGVITHSGEMSGLNILSGIDIDSSSFSLLKPVLYKGDLAILKYSGLTGEYCVSSLSSLNTFGRPYDHISGIIENPPKELVDYNGQILLFTDEDDYLIYFLETSESIRYPKKNGGIKNCVILDHWDPEGRVKYISEADLKEEISRLCPTPIGFESNSYSYREKIGKWWIFYGPSGLVYLSVYGIITKGEVRMDFINSKLGMYQEPKTGVFHFLPIDTGHTYEFQGLRVLDKTSGEYSDLGIKPSHPISTLSPDLRCFLNGIRKKPLRTRGCFPRRGIIGTELGIIFYLSEGLLYCY